MHFMRKHIVVKSFCRFAFIAGLVALIASCSPSNTPKTGLDDSVEEPVNLALLTEADLVAKYREVIKNAENSMAEPIYYAIGQELAKFGPQALHPLIDFLGDASNTHRERVATADVLKYFLAPSQIPRMKGLLDTSHDGTARACATFLLGFLPGEETDAIFRGLLDDEERRVWFSAKLGLAKNGDEAMLEELKAMYEDESTPETEVIQIIKAVLVRGRPKDIDLLMGAVVNEKVAEFQRAEVAQALGRLGNPAAIPVLERCSREGGEALKNVALAAIDVIRRE